MRTLTVNLTWMQACEAALLEQHKEDAGSAALATQLGAVCGSQASAMRPLNAGRTICGQTEHACMFSPEGPVRDSTVTRPQWVSTLHTAISDLMRKRVVTTGRCAAAAAAVGQGGGELPASGCAPAVQCQAQRRGVLRSTASTGSNLLVEVLHEALGTMMDSSILVMTAGARAM